MDIDIVTEVKEAMLGNELAVCLTNHPDCNSRNTSASQHAKRSHNACSSSGLK